jgi:hypothetical protein
MMMIPCLLFLSHEQKTTSGCSPFLRKKKEAKSPAPPLTSITTGIAALALTLGVVACLRSTTAPFASVVAVLGSLWGDEGELDQLEVGHFSLTLFCSQTPIDDSLCGVAV